MSYASVQNVILDNSTAANFRLWGSALSAAMLAMGWIQTSDTGQVNWTTVAVPSNAYVYEIWKPGDAGTVFYLKIIYGYNTSTPTWGVQLGTGTNGAGTLTGFTTNAFQSTQTGNWNLGTTVPTYFSGDTNRCGVMMWCGGNPPSGFFGVERTKNTDGTDNNIGVTLWGCTYNGSRLQHTIVFGVGVSQAWTIWVNLLNGGSVPSSDQAFVGTIPMSPCFPCYGKFDNPNTVCGCVPASDVGEQCYFTTTLYGGTRTYMATGMNGAAWLPMGSINQKLAMRFD